MFLENVLFQAASVVRGNGERQNNYIAQFFKERFAIAELRRMSRLLDFTVQVVSEARKAGRRIVETFTFCVVVNRTLQRVNRHVTIFHAPVNAFIRRKLHHTILLPLATNQDTDLVLRVHLIAFAIRLLLFHQELTIQGREF